ncbi:hypothetical protein M9H77_24137 [Catharanthus roseus]|uniref:Uncharacterized protein n=1 Tax=Catharanthus roseus TaxID=4058 RepID=A0ACC0AXF8_CATRO|nr:hypothetical protein M9H77_24137 [Catharanthus roseus]
MAATGGQKHLHELLKEDQEPFQLNNYIADKKRCLNIPPPPTKTTSLQVKKRKPIVESNPSSKRSLCKQACFFAFHDSPDVTKSPLPDFLSPAVKSPIRAPKGTVFLHIPARTAALLVEAAMRIQKQQQSKTQIKNVGFGLFSSILKKLKDRNNRNTKSEIRDKEITKSSPRKTASVTRMEEENMGFSSCSCNNSRLSSAGWSESNEAEENVETSTSSFRSEYSEELHYISRAHQNGAFSPYHKRCNSSPVSPFIFSLPGSPSSGRRTPIFLSPAASPSRRKVEDKENYEAKGLGKIQAEEDDEKEQCSPVSVLDPPFDNIEEEEVSGQESSGDEEEEDYDDNVECSSFAIVQKAKEQLLYKLRRFEKLAELDPIELEKRMMEQLEEEDEDEEDEQQKEDKEFIPLYKTCNLDSFVNEVFSKSDILSRRKVPADMKKLVSDLISEENNEIKSLDSSSEIVLGRVCRKLDSWKEVESNTIDMMVELDFRSEFDQWKRFQEQRDETAVEIELEIFSLLVEELTEELK